MDGDVVDDHRTYFIGESTKFDGGGKCENANLNTVTSTLRSRLVNAGWEGFRFVDENTWPEDFRETTAMDFALDVLYADAARLAVYAGHGGIGTLQWGRPSPDEQCLTYLDDVRLGTLAGDTAAAVMFMTSCTMRVDQVWPALRENACRQFFGYHNSPHIGYDEARKVFKRTQDGQSTVDAWLEEMVHNALGNNSPVAFTMGIDAEDAIETHGNTNLATGEGYMQNVGEPPDNHFYEWFDNGCNDICGNCSADSQVAPEVTLGAPASRLRLTRPTRSSAELLDLAVELLERFDIESPTADELDRLEAWASEIVASGDVVHARIVDEPRIDLTYDPSSDELRITNRSALARARPRPGEVVDDDPELAAELALEAAAIRDQMQTLPGALDRLGTKFESSARKVGFGGTGEPASDSIAIEWLFTAPGRVDDFKLEGMSLTIGLTRLGELSTFVMSAVDVETLGDTRLVQTPAQALDRLRETLQAEYPTATVIEFVAPQVGYALAEARDSAEVAPSLLVSYVLGFGSDESRVVSRSFPVAISLVESNPTIEPLLAVDPNPGAGDARVSH